MTVINAGHYGRAVYDLHVRRAAHRPSPRKCSDAAYDAPFDQPPADNRSESVESRTLSKSFEDAPGTRLRTALDRRCGLREAIEGIERAYQADGALLGLPVGIKTMERRLGVVSRRPT